MLDWLESEYSSNAADKENVGGNSLKIKTKKQNAMVSLSCSLLFAILVLSFALFSISSIADRNVQQERLSVMEQFSKFQTETEITIKESIYLLEGYLAYINTAPDVSAQASEDYIRYLFSNKEEYIRSIAIIKDTTIVLNYPKEGNEKAIGVDLATVPDQKDELLYVKNNLKPTFVGPVDLLEGGSGFIVRMPIEKNGNYWGQMGVVLSREKYFQRINEIAEKNHLNIVVFKKNPTANVPILGDESIVNRDGLELDMEILNSTWMIAVEPLGGWNNFEPYIFTLKIIALFASIILGTLLFFTLYSRGQLKHQAFFDSLTGLLNRHALNNFYESSHGGTPTESLEVIMLDIDRFKNINDLYGHDAGDLVLIEFSKRLNDIPIKNKKTYRVGGDEFLIIINNNEKKESSFPIRVDTLREHIIFERTFADQQVKIVPSIGIANYSKDGATIDAAIVVADRKMYEDKQTRRTQASQTMSEKGVCSDFSL